MGCTRNYTVQDHLNAKASRASASAVTDQLNDSLVRQAMRHMPSQVIRDLVEYYQDTPEYLNAILSTLVQLGTAKIRGLEEVVYDLMSTATKARGAEFQLHYVLKHLDEIAALAEPVGAQTGDGRWYGREGPDIRNHDGSVIELKCFNFGSSYYDTHAETVVAKVVAQARSRLIDDDTITKIVFSSWYGEMPGRFRAALEAQLRSEPRIRWAID